MANGVANRTAYIFTSPDYWVTTKQACRDGEFCLLTLFLLSVDSSTQCIEPSYEKPINRKIS